MAGNEGGEVLTIIRNKLIAITKVKIRN